LVGDSSVATNLFGRQQKHFSECVAFSILTSPRVDGALRRVVRAEANLWTPPQSMCSIFLAGIEDPSRVQWFPYSRYWHGHQLFHKVILSYFDYRFFLKLMNLLFSLSLVVFAVTLSAKFRLLPTATFLVVFLLLSPSLWSWFDPTQAISFASLIFGGVFFARYGAGRPLSEAAGPALFAGAVLNYFDFLYFPAMLAVTICWLDAISRPRARQAAFDPVPLFLGLVTIAGYLAMWTMRWLLALIWSAFEHTYSVSAGDFSRWLLGGGDSYVPLAATFQILEWTFLGPVGRVVGVCLLAGLLALVIRDRLAFVRYTVQVSLIPALLGLGILEVMAKHSISHPFSVWTAAWIAAVFAFNCVHWVRLPANERRRRSEFSLWPQTRSRVAGKRRPRSRRGRSV
jgi:hypothetical protein